VAPYSHVRPVGDEEFMATCLGEFSAGERRRADRLVDIALRSFDWMAASTEETSSGSNHLGPRADRAMSRTRPGAPVGPP
jgi:hypothetical protein